MLALFAPAVPPRAAVHYRGRGIFLLVGAGLAVTAHLVDVLQARGPNWPALAIRAAWAALLVANAVVVLRMMRPCLSWLSAVDALVTPVLYLALLAATGGSESPLLVYAYPLAMVIPVLLPELPTAATLGACLLVLGALGLLVRGGASAGALLAWAHVSVVSVLVGTVMARATLRTRLALDRETEAREATLAQLGEALQNVKTLTGLLPICIHCKRIRDDRGYWERIEAYISTRTDASFTHGLCPECFEEHYPGKE